MIRPVLSLKFEVGKLWIRLQVHQLEKPHYEFTPMKSALHRTRERGPFIGRDS
jgi:hypothetical protein